MIPTLQAEVKRLLHTRFDPYVQKTWADAKVVKHLKVEDGIVTVEIVLGYPLAGLRDSIIAGVRADLLALKGVEQVEISLTWKIEPHSVVPGLVIKGVKNIIAVGSGKGGVGKSTTATNLALALAAEGAKVGILDGDIYGPNQPHILGVTEQIKPVSGQHLTPILAHGIQSMSIGYLVDTDTPMVWRGPMVSTALQQLLRDTTWEYVDYLIVDLPPGTGDIQLTLAQKMPVSGAIIVTTPQDVALLDARRGLEMFKKVKVPVLGIIENMSTHICSQCGTAESIFGEGGGERMAKDYEVELLGQLPLDRKIREHSDLGKPIVAIEPEGKTAQIYREMARKLAAKLSLEPKNYTSKFPKIIIEPNDD